VNEIENLEILLLQAPMQDVRDGEGKKLSKMLSQNLMVPQSRNLGARFCRGMKYFFV
jgi:respiratory burst oxidase